MGCIIILCMQTNRRSTHTQTGNGVRFHIYIRKRMNQKLHHIFTQKKKKGFRDGRHHLRRVPSRTKMTTTLSLFMFQPVLHDWCNKGRGMCYPVCGMVHIKEPLLLIDKSSLCGGSGYPFSLSEWSLTICLTPYNRR